VQRDTQSPIALTVYQNTENSPTDNTSKQAANVTCQVQNLRLTIFTLMFKTLRKNINKIYD